jgi:hypothetical protein
MAFNCGVWSMIRPACDRMGGAVFNGQIESDIVARQKALESLSRSFNGLENGTGAEPLPSSEAQDGGAV